MSQVVVYHNLQVNNTYAAFVRSIADFFSTEWFPRTKDIVISTYEKAVERERMRRANASENYSPSYPFITFNPELEFEPDELVGNFFYQYPEFMTLFGAQQWNPRIYEDENLYIAPNFNRYKGTFEMILWCSSVYELIDWRTRIFQFFGGMNRIIQPGIEGYFVIPDSIKIFQYRNSYTGEEYVINWDQSLVENYLIKNINQPRMVFSFINWPMLKLTGVGDGSDKYGNSSEDEISEHRITVNIEWEMWMPVHLVLVANSLPTFCHKFELDLRVGYQYVAASAQAERTLTTSIHKFATWADEDSTALETVQLIWDQSYCYFLTEEDIETFAASRNVTVTLPADAPDCVYVELFTKYGKMIRDFQWKLAGIRSVNLIGMNMGDYKDGDMISFEIYRED